MGTLIDWIKVGATCIRTRYIPPRGRGLYADRTRAIYPIIGGIYTIRKIVFCSLTGDPLLLLEEIVNLPQRGFEPGFSATAFRPVVDESEDIELFTSYLHHARVDVTLDALNAAWDAERTE